MDYLGFTVITDESINEGQIFFVPNHLNLVLAKDGMKVREGSQIRDLTEDEKKHFASIKIYQSKITT